MLTIRRRHSKKCPDRIKGPNYLKSRGHCPLRVCGTADGRRVRESLKTRDLRRAARRIVEIEDRSSGKVRKTIKAAVEAFQAQHAENAPETQCKYKRHLAYLTDFCAGQSITYVDTVTSKRWTATGCGETKTTGSGSRKSNSCASSLSFAVTASGQPRIPRKG